MAFHFSPLKDFQSKEFKSTYCKGLVYTVRDGNDKLAAAVQTWLKEGKVRLGGTAGQPGAAAMKGQGKVG